MKILLDACSFLWLTLDEPQLSRVARQVFADPDNQIYLSAVSSWEIAVKYSLGKLPLPEPADRFISTYRKLHGIEAIPLDEECALYVGRLPRFHGDPFDRMLICQAIVHGMPILTPDPAITQYPVRILW